MAVLTSMDDSVVRQKIDIDQSAIVIGRHPECEVIIDDGSVSRRHAQILNSDGVYFVEDLESRNGTFVNNSPVHRKTRLFDGAEIRICDVHFIFHLEDNSVFRTARPTIAEQSGNGQRHSGSVILEDDERLSTVMSQLDVPSHHARTEKPSNAEAKLQALIKITRALSESLELNHSLSNILDCLFELFVEADRGFIVLKEESGQLNPLGMKMRKPNDERVRVSRTIVNQVLETKRPLISSDAASDQRFDLSQSITDFRIRSIMCAPLINTNDESIGVIQLDTLKNKIAFNEDDLEILVTVAMQASLALQKLDLIEETLRIKELDSDLKLAHEVQQAFLPQRRPNFDDYEFYSFYSATMDVGGDYYDYIPVKEDEIAIVVADVVGHGVAAALLMAKVAAESRFALATHKCPVKAIHQINQNLSGLNLDKFVTLLMVVVNRRTHSAEIVNAGHMPPIVRNAKGEVTQVAQGESGLPLGIFEDATYSSSTIKLTAGDVVLMYTDGLNESMNSDGEQLGIKRLIDEIRVSQTKRPSTVGKFVCQTVNRHIDGEQLHDDMCIVCVGRRAEEQPTQESAPPESK